MMEVVHSINLIVSNPNMRGGKPCILGTTLRVMDVVGAMQYRQLAPHEIAATFDITLEQTHAALAYYYGHQAEVDMDLATEDELAAQMKEQRVGSRHKPLLG